MQWLGFIWWTHGRGPGVGIGYLRQMNAGTCRWKGCLFGLFGMPKMGPKFSHFGMPMGPNFIECYTNRHFPLWQHLCQPVCVICTQGYVPCPYIVHSVDFFLYLYNVVWVQMFFNYGIWIGFNFLNFLVFEWAWFQSSQRHHPHIYFYVNDHTGTEDELRTLARMERT